MIGEQDLVPNPDWGQKRPLEELQVSPNLGQSPNRAKPHLSQSVPKEGGGPWP